MKTFSDYFQTKDGGVVGINRRAINAERKKFLAALEANGLNRDDPIYSLVVEDFEDQFAKVEQIGRRLTELTKERKGMEYDFNRVLNVVGSAVDKEGWGEGGSRENVSYTEEQIARDIAKAAEGEEFAALEELKELLDSSTLQGNKIVIPKSILNVQDEEGDPAVYKVSEGETLMGPAVFAKYLRQFEEERGIDLENMLPARFASATGEQLKEDFDELYNNATEQIESSQNVIKEFEDLTKDLVRDTSVVNDFFENVDRPIDLVKVLSPETLRLIEDQQDLLTSSDFEGKSARDKSPYGTVLIDNVSNEYARREALPESPTYTPSVFERERYVPPAGVTRPDDVRRDPLQLAPNDPRRGVSPPEMEAAAIEGELDLQEAEIEDADLQESFIDRVTDENQMVPEFGAPTPTSVGGGRGGQPSLEGSKGLDEETRQYIIDNFSMAGFLLQLPEGQLTAELEVPPGSGNMVTVDNVMAYIDENGITDTNQIKGMFLQTKWYNETEPQRREWQAQWYGEGGEVNQTWADSTANQRALLDDEMDQIRREAERLGLDLDDEALWNLAFEAKSMGFDTYEIRENFVKTYEDALFASDEGRFEVTRNDIREDAAQYMTTWTDEDLDNAARRVYLGETTVEEIEAGIRAQAKADNPALASLIDQGYTPQMYFASYAKEAENLLERKVDFLGGDKGLYDQLVGTDWSSDGLARPMTRAEFGRTLRATPEWQYTDNARDAAYDAASQIARMFGAIG